MPTYEYECAQCAKVAPGFGVFSEVRRISDPPSTWCPQCGSTAIKPLLFAVPAKLTGGGWAKDGYVKGSK
jgi:putative FmdB family regulatory protein